MAIIGRLLSGKLAMCVLGGDCKDTDMGEDGRSSWLERGCNIGRGVLKESCWDALLYTCDRMGIVNIGECIGSDFSIDYLLRVGGEVDQP